jgi:hypothetical protein
MITSFTVFAPQRSGTNFTELLITENFQKIYCHLPMNEYAWKHEPNAKRIYSNYNEQKNELSKHLHLLVTKYIYKWIESIQRNPVDIVLRRKELLDVSSCNVNEKLKIKNNMQVPLSWSVGELNLIELVKLWNEFYENWLQMGPKFKHWGIVKYESLLIKELRQNFLQSFHKTYGLPKTIKNGWNLPVAVPMSPRWNDSLAVVKSKDYLQLEKSYFLNAQQIDVIDKLVNKELLEQLGYPLNKPLTDL